MSSPNASPAAAGNADRSPEMRSEPPAEQSLPVLKATPSSSGSRPQTITQKQSTEAWDQGSSDDANESEAEWRRLEERRRHDVYERIPPLLIMPTRLEETDMPLSHKAHPAKEWLPRAVLETPWLTLFYDLVMVAVLNTFATDHEIVAPGDLGVFFSYFVVIWWIWMSQTAHDLRFATDDIVHRFFRLLQLCSFLYMGAAGNTWAPTQLQQTASIGDGLGEGVHEEDLEKATTQTNALDSFQLVAIAYAASRGILAAQYILGAVMAGRRRRPLASHLLPLLGAVVSLGLAALAAALSASTKALAIVKPTILYLGIAIEAIVEVVTPRLHSYLRPSREALSDRLASLTLIVIGEGFISLVRAVDLSINGFTRTDGMTYLAAFCCVIILFMVWLYYFNHFRPRDYLGKKRALVWTILHFPLHYCILIMIAGMVNALHYRGFYSGTTNAVQSFVNILDINSGNVSVHLSPSAQRRIAVSLGELAIQPPLADEFRLLMNATNNDEAEILVAQYVGQIVVNFASQFGIEFSANATESYKELMAINATAAANSTAGDPSGLGTQAVNIFGQFLGSLMEASLEGTLWLLPSAGLVLCMLALLGLVRYQFRDSHVMYPDIALFGWGVVVGLLGLLAVGGKEIVLDEAEADSGDLGSHSINPLYIVVNATWILPLVAGLYGGFWVVCTAILALFRRRRDRYSAQRQRAEPPRTQAGEDEGAAAKDEEKLKSEQGS